MGARAGFASATCALLCWSACVPLLALSEPGTRDSPAGSGLPERYPLADVRMTIEIQHSPWAGSYVDTITITGLGEGRFQGSLARAHVPGVDTLTVLPARQRIDQSFTVPCDSALSLLDAFYEADFFDLRPDYSRGYGAALLGDSPRAVAVVTHTICDLEVIRVSVRIGDHVHSVCDSGFGPLDLQRLEERFLTIAQAERWTAVPAAQQVRYVRAMPGWRRRPHCPDTAQ